MLKERPETSDLLARYARVGQVYGKSAYAYIGFFAVAGLAACGSLEWQSAETRFLWAAIAGMSIAVAALLYSGFVIAWIARDTVRRFEAFEQRLKQLFSSCDPDFPNHRAPSSSVID